MINLNNFFIFYMYKDMDEYISNSWFEEFLKTTNEENKELAEEIERSEFSNEELAKEIESSEFSNKILFIIFILSIVIIIYYRNDIINYIYNKVYCKKKDDKSK